MKKFEIFVKLFVVLLVIFCFESYFKGEIIQKTFMDINEYYYLESGPDPFYSVFICESKGNKVNLDCFVVEEISERVAIVRVRETKRLYSSKSRS